MKNDKTMTGPSAELQRYDLSMDGHIEPNEGGDYVLRDSALSALSRAREDARREAHAAASAAFTRWWVYSMDLHGAPPHEIDRFLERFREELDAVQRLLTPTPQGETKEKQP